jgi:hypothetical protein
MGVREIASLLTLGLLAWSTSPVRGVQTPSLTADQFQGPDVERFLSAAGILRGPALTADDRIRSVTLKLGDVERRAIFKTNERPGAVRDNWTFEIAAYILDRTIGLGMVPATIERVVEGRRGALQWWVDSMMSESQRRAKAIDPPDRESFDRLVLKAHLFDQLIANGNRLAAQVLITKEFDLRLIDHSGAFTTARTLSHPGRLSRFSRGLLGGLTKLDYETLRRHMGDGLEDAEIRALLARRDAILAAAAKAVAEKGEAAVLYD